MSAQQPMNNEPNVNEIPKEVVTEDVTAQTTTPETTEPQAPISQEQQTQLDNTVVNQMSEAMASDQVTAEDIMVAILTDTLGVSPGAAQSLCRMFVQDMAEQAIENSQPPAGELTQLVNNDVPPQVM